MKVAAVALVSLVLIAVGAYLLVQGFAGGWAIAAGFLLMWAVMD